MHTNRSPAGSGSRVLIKLWRRGWVIPAGVVSTIFHGTLSQLVAIVDPSSIAQIRVARSWARSLLWIVGVKVEVEGLERVRGIDKCVWASNHVTFMDTPVMLTHIPVQFFFLAKSELFKWPFVGWHLTRAGHVPVPLDDPKASLRTLSQAAKLLAERGVSVLFFPEGGRSETGELQDFKDGAAYIAIKAQGTAGARRAGGHSRYVADEHARFQQRYGEAPFRPADPDGGPRRASPRGDYERLPDSDFGHDARRQSESLALKGLALKGKRPAFLPAAFRPLTTPRWFVAS
ncbi:MAG: lysophospholipid acyltransferase family protein [Acidobacteriota bacterium]